MNRQGKNERCRYWANVLDVTMKSESSSHSLAPFTVLQKLVKEPPRSSYPKLALDPTIWKTICYFHAQIYVLGGACAYSNDGGVPV